MSFRDIGAIINKAKLQAERERGYAPEDTQPKSPESRAFKMFSEGKSLVEVAIALDEPGDRVRAMYREYWELTGKYRLAQIYDEARYDIYGLLRLHKIVKDLGLGEKEIIKVLELAKYDELQNLQWKVEYLRNEIGMLEDQKTKATNNLLVLNRRIDEFEARLNMYVPWVQQKGQMGYMNQESRISQWPVNYNAGNLYPQPNANWYSLDVSYTNHYCG